MRLYRPKGLRGRGLKVSTIMMIIIQVAERWSQ